MRRSRVAIWAAAIVLGSHAFGCGGDEDQTTAIEVPGAAQKTDASGAKSPPDQGPKKIGGSGVPAPGSPLDEEQFIRRADSICRDLNRQISRFEDANSLSELEAAVNQIQPILASGTRRLRELEAPSILTARFAQFLDAVEAQSAVLARIGNEAARGDIGGVQRLGAELRRVRDRKRQIAAQAGFSECGSG